MIPLNPPHTHKLYSAILGISAVMLGSASAQLLLEEDFTADDGGFVSTSEGAAVQPWVYNSGTGTWSANGEVVGTAVTNYLTTPAIPVAAEGYLEIQFEHKYSFEAQFDGGGLQMSVDGGTFVNVPTRAFSAEPYTVDSLTGAHDLLGLPGFSGDSTDAGIGSYVTSIAAPVIKIPAGSAVVFRFTGAFDANTIGAIVPNWEVTAVTVSRRLDDDTDGMPDDYETANGLNPADPSDAATDADLDDVSNLQEFENETDPQDDDTDDDNLKDGVESNTGTYVDATNSGTDPRNPDTDGDGLLDGAEDPNLSFVDQNQAGTNPHILDSDGDGFDDGLEVLASNSNPTNPASRPIRGGLLDIIAYWDFNDASDPTATVDLVKGFRGDLKTGTLFSADATGRTLAAGDRALDMGATGNAGTGVIVEQGRFLGLAGAQDQIGISFWINMPDFQQSMAVYANSPAVERAFSSHAPWSNGQVYWDTGGCCDGGGQRANVAAGFIVSTWNHVVLNKNGDTKAIWVNGVKVLEKTNTEDLPTEFTRFFIGTDSNSLNTVGLLDDMAIYADALSDAEIASLAAGDDPLSIVPPNDDTDGDGMPDAYESANGLNPAVDDAGDDLDADDVTNFTEYLNGTDPQDDDSDDDNLKDGVETNTGIWVSITDTGTDPLNSDSDGDTLSDGLENPDLPFVDAAQPGTNPNLLDTDGDTFSDSQELQLETDPTLDTSVPVAGEQELLVYYDFNGQTADQTGNAPDATFVGNAALTTGGMGASGLAGDESLDLMTANDGSAALVAAGNHLARVNLNNAAAVSFWLYKTQTAASSAFWLRSPSAGNNQRGFQAHATWSDGTTYFDVAGQTGGSARLTSAGFTFENQWQQFVFQKTSTGELQIWIDGTMQANSFDAPDLLPLDGDITLGAFNGLANSFSGRLDDFAVFSEALDSEQIGLLAGGADPSALFGPPVPFIITEISYDEDTDKTTLTWNSKNSGLYSIDYSLSLEDPWEEIVDDVSSAGTSTTMELPALNAESRLFFRIRRTN